MDFKHIAFKEIDNCSKKLFDLASFLHENPETAFQETKAHDYICDLLENEGFSVERNFMYETGFRDSYQTSCTPHFAILVEYDALPEIGHACGHNIIAQSSIASALGLKAAMDKGLKCKLTVLGTPAEEGGGGKIKFVSEGIFQNVDVAIMSHPNNSHILKVPSLAIIGLTISFIGKEAHASVAPWEGVNALDAAVLAYQSISCLRQQMPPDYRIHGIISKGGDAANIIPNLTEMKYYIRAPTAKLLREFLDRVYPCFSGAAKMTKCDIIFKESCPLYEHILFNSALAEQFSNNATILGIEFISDVGSFKGSTDAGNVSQVCPTLHPMFDIGCNSELHTKEFTSGAGTVKAKERGILQGKIMAGTLIDICLDESGNILKNIKLDFEKNKDK